MVELFEGVGGSDIVAVGVSETETVGDDEVVSVELRDGVETAIVADVDCEGDIVIDFVAVGVGGGVMVVVVETDVEGDIDAVQEVEAVPVGVGVGGSESVEDFNLDGLEDPVPVFDEVCEALPVCVGVGGGVMDFVSLDASEKDKLLDSLLVDDKDALNVADEEDDNVLDSRGRDAVRLDDSVLDGVGVGGGVTVDVVDCEPDVDRLAAADTELVVVPDEIDTKKVHDEVCNDSDAVPLIEVDTLIEVDSVKVSLAQLRMMQELPHNTVSANRRRVVGSIDEQNGQGEWSESVAICDVFVMLQPTLLHIQKYSHNGGNCLTNVSRKRGHSVTTQKHPLPCLDSM